MSEGEQDASVLGKRARNGEVDVDIGPQPAADDSDDDVGPMPMPVDAPTGAVKKRRKVLPHEKLYLEHIPDAEQYYKSFMHRDMVNFCVVTKTEFIITTSIDGHLKFWKKQEVGIEFVKHYRAHLTPVTAVAASTDGQLFASISEDETVKIFDVVNFDMINIIKLGYKPHACCWVHPEGQSQGLVAISDAASGVIRIYDARGDGTPAAVVDNVHRFPVHVMAYSDRYDTVISADEGGFIEYWEPREPYESRKDVPGLWQYKSETDLFEFKKSKSTPTCITLSPDSSSFVTFSLPDRQIRVFSFLKGKLTRKYDESLTAIQEMQQAGTAVHKVEDMEFGRRLAMERELELPDPEGRVAARWSNAVWDESGCFIIYASLLGIKVVNVVTNRVARLLGKDEAVRYINVSLYQGAPSKKSLTTMAMAASANPILADKGQRDPTLFCTGFKRERFYMFTRSEPGDQKSGERDVFNERPTRETQNIASAAPAAASSGPSPLADAATIHTTVGDIHMRLFPQHAPKAVENFVGHARSAYFEGVIFHRVIPKFMIQTGDPLGDGTGGTSIWGREFEDEFSDELKHDRPYTVSMANAGPGTNGSQFFITTTATPWLDKKHTIFGRVLSGLEVVHAIENVKTNKGDKPYEDIKIVNVDVE
ncbi:hypothetical protein BD626DRAFT_493498 [Schizophyllum amplum]|uniref:peptidylprolyl isomerase n=1 Tax=Schizophyllum amplum TaxID=97359 RepID=A0A550CGU8_9AGAR|nr:hypothetical protein BD626DRAFT_493498 [Auriculariopsis ampla]